MQHGAEGSSHQFLQQANQLLRTAVSGTIEETKSRSTCRACASFVLRADPLPPIRSSSPAPLVSSTSSGLRTADAAPLMPESRQRRHPQSFLRGYPPAGCPTRSCVAMNGKWRQPRLSLRAFQEAVDSSVVIPGWLQRGRRTPHPRAEMGHRRPPCCGSSATCRTTGAPARRRWE